ncbi:MAG TPA: hypothetical protein PK530_22730, partial [Anaerolineales bacterium]|nr:hypothetical protein [Anaerolineales bacterium]
MDQSENTKPDLTFLEGAICTKIEFGEPEQWSFHFGENVFLHVGCLWRIISNNRIELTNLDHKQKFGLPKPVDAREQLRDIIFNQEISTFTIRKVTSDIVIIFRNRVILEILTNSSGYESWQLSYPNG